jgi:hypothetical protein
MFSPSHRRRIVLLYQELFPLAEPHPHETRPTNLKTLAAYLIKPVHHLLHPERFAQPSIPTAARDRSKPLPPNSTTDQHDRPYPPEKAHADNRSSPARAWRGIPLPGAKRCWKPSHPGRLFLFHQPPPVQKGPDLGLPRSSAVPVSTAFWQSTRFRLATPYSPDSWAYRTARRTLPYILSSPRSDKLKKKSHIHATNNLR